LRKRISLNVLIAVAGPERGLLAVLWWMNAETDKTNIG
jgi:hypothetical protein